MIYDKPRDIKMRVLPSLSSLGSKSEKKKKLKEEKKKTDNLINEAQQEPAFKPAPPPLKNDNVDIILEGTPTFIEELQLQDNTIFDISQMPIIDGIPMLELPDEHAETEKEEPILIEEETVYDVSEKTETTEIPHIDFKEPPPKKEKVKKEKKKKAKKVKSVVNKTHFIKVASFLLILYLGTVISFIIPLRPTYSESEKRNLTEFPEFNIEALTSGDYFSDISTWFSDTFPFREQLTKANSFIKGLYGIETVTIHGDIDKGDEIPDAPIEETTGDKPEDTTKPDNVSTDDKKDENNNLVTQKPNFKVQKLGAIIVAGDSGYEFYAFSNKLAPRFVNAVNKIEEKSKPTGKVYALVAPTSIDIKLDDSLRAETKSADQKKALEYFNSSFKNVVAVDGIYDSEREHRDEYTYFRTDHHWTALGAYYAYEDFASAKGVRPVPLSSYETVKFTDFKGTFYSNSKQSKKLGKKPDYVTAYKPINKVTCQITRANGTTFNWPVIKDVNDYKSGMKYLTFIGGDNPLTTIKNLDNPTGTSCVVIKDSYGNAFVPFLIPHYSTIYVIDPRHYEKSLESFCKNKEITDVVFITNISVTRNSIYIQALEELLK